MLTDDQDETLWVASASLAAARRAANGDLASIGSAKWFAETLGLSEADRQAVSRESAESSVIDPVVQYMLRATCGILYGPLIGRLKSYPIPELRLPEGQGRRLLDVGCNWGRWSLAAARKGYDVVGLDPSLGAVLAAARVARQLGLSAHFVVGDARCMPFPDGAFGTVFSYSVLQHFSRADAGSTLNEIGRVLGKGGNSLIQMANRFGIRSFYHLFRRRFTDGTGFDVRYWTPSELKREFATRIGPSRLAVDGYFGLGIQGSDRHLMPPSHRLVIDLSQVLRRVSRVLPWITFAADSLYVSSTRDRASAPTAERIAH